MKQVSKYFERRYKEIFSFIKEIKKFIFLSIFIFLFFFALGFFINLPSDLELQLMNYLKEILAQTEGFSAFQMITFLFMNNSLASLFGFIFGIGFGIFPIFSSASNGFIVGFVSEMSVSKFGFSSLFSLLPHGIFELPALFISLGMGLNLGFCFFSKKKKKFRIFFEKSILTYVFFVLPLLLIAAIIEGILIVLI